MELFLDGFGDREYIFGNLRYADQLDDYKGFEFVVVGGACLILLGVEVTIHGEPRLTEDLDIVKYGKLKKSLRDLSGVFEFHTAEFYHLYLDGWRDRLYEMNDFENIRVYYLNEVDLLFSKLARGLPKDIEDCVALLSYFEFSVEELEYNFKEWLRCYPNDEELVTYDFRTILRMAGYA